MLRYMLDTKICIYALKHRPPAVRDAFEANSTHLCTSAVVLAELLYGAEKSARPVANRDTVEAFAARLEVLAFDHAAADHYGRLRADLEARGQPIRPYELMIAAHARSAGLTLVSNNTREFERVPGLLLENWAA
jgi:tRNA(fMet)-specific endonuclease VapC